MVRRVLRFTRGVALKAREMWRSSNENTLSVAARVRNVLVLVAGGLRPELSGEAHPFLYALPAGRHDGHFGPHSRRQNARSVGAAGGRRGETRRGRQYRRGFRRQV